MVYSYTQISQYLSCPRRYRYRYLDGWQVKETRAGMLFGRAFEAALAAYFRRQDPADALFREWAQFKDKPLEYPRGETWDELLQQGITLLRLFVQDDRVQIPNPARDLQVRISHRLPGGNEFLAYVDAIGTLDAIPAVIDWKTTGCRYPTDPEGLLALDLQLVCYSWLTGTPEVAFVVFVRKRRPEIQYLRTRITDEQREEFGRLVQDTIARIECGQFLPHSGIRFPHNGCLSCPFLGLCVKDQTLVEAHATRRAGGELDWIDELDY